MSRKRVLIGAAVTVFLLLAAAFVVYKYVLPSQNAGIPGAGQSGFAAGALQVHQVLRVHQAPQAPRELPEQEAAFRAGAVLSRMSAIQSSRPRHRIREKSL